MKNIINITLMLMLYSVSRAQCLVYAEDELAKYRRGTQLTCQELNNNVREASLLLFKGNIYTLYLLNPTHKNTGYSLLNDFNKQGNYLQIINKNEDFQKYVIPASKNIEHKILLNLNDKKTCLLLAIYLHDTIPDKLAGIYNSFEDFRNNKPVDGYITTFSEGKEHETIFYSMSDKEERKKYRKIYGFCDGADIYLNAATVYPVFGRENRFARAEKIGKYYYLRTTRLIFVNNVAVPVMVQLIVDSNSGEVTELTKNSLRKIISDDQALLKEFQSEKNKQKGFKEYLKKYSVRKQNLSNS